MTVDLGWTPPLDLPVTVKQELAAGHGWRGLQGFVCVFTGTLALTSPH